MTGSALKLIAVLTMAIDHFCKMFRLSSVLIALGTRPDFAGTASLLIGWTGRMAFPLFAFCAAEGMRHTSDRWRYFGRLLQFAVLAEIPYRLTLAKSAAFGCCNIMFTIALSVLAVAVWSSIPVRKGSGFWKSAVLLAAVAAAELLRCDYGGFGVLVILSAYFAADRKKLIAVWALLFGCYYFLKPILLTAPLRAAGVAVYAGRTLFTFLSFPLILRYNGQRGKDGKWLFYIFYPLHLLLLYLLRQIIP